MPPYHQTLRGMIAVLGTGLFCLGSSCSLPAQTLFINPPRESLGLNEVFTFDLMVDRGIGTAIAWETHITLERPGGERYLEFVPDFGGSDKPFRNLQPFFNYDFSSFSVSEDTLDLRFINFPIDSSSNPDGIFNNNEFVTLGQFQIRVLRDIIPGLAHLPGVGINLAPREIPADPALLPYRSTVFDEEGNNLLIAIESARVTSNPAGLGSRSVPEPASWLVLSIGTAYLTISGFRRRGVGVASKKLEVDLTAFTSSKILDLT